MEKCYDEIKISLPKFLGNCLLIKKCKKCFELFEQRVHLPLILVKDHNQTNIPKSNFNFKPNICISLLLLISSNDSPKNDVTQLLTPSSP